MDKIKGIIYFWGAIIGAEILVLAAALTVFFLSPTLQERTYEAMLVPNSPLLREYGAYKLRNYPSRAAALALVAMLNLQSKDGRGQDAAETALGSLRELSGQPFQEGWKEGDAFDVPTSDQAWAETLSRVNNWAFTAFGADALAALAKMGMVSDGGNLSITTTAGPAGGSTAAGPAGEGVESFTFPLSDGSWISLSLGDTAGLGDRLDAAGIAPDSRFANAMMAGNTTELRAVFEDAVRKVEDGDTAGARSLFGFFGLPLPGTDESHVGETVGGATVTNGGTAENYGMEPEPEGEGEGSEPEASDGASTPADGATGWELMIQQKAAEAAAQEPADNGETESEE